MDQWQQSLNGDWNLLVDRQNVGVKNQWFDPQILQIRLKNSQDVYKISVPSNFNTISDLFHYAGVVWYHRVIPAIEISPDLDYSLKFEGINYIADIWMNGEKIGHHEGGFLPFEICIPRKFLLEDQPNEMIVRVDAGVKADGIPGESCDWFNWGGIHRNVFLRATSPHRFDTFQITSSFETAHPSQANITVTFQLHQFSAILAEIQKDPELSSQPSLVVKVTSLGILHSKKGNRPHTVFEQTFRWDQLQPESSGYILQNSTVRSLWFQIDNPQLWSPKHPHLYELQLDVSLPSNPHILPLNESCSSRFGIRSIAVHGANLLLNHAPFKMQGVSLHEEQEPFGRHYSAEMRKNELLTMKSMGFNALRSAHYTHDEILCHLCDEIGLVLFEEIPLYWNIQFSNPKTMKLAGRMIYDMIQRDFNHPSVILWSIGNEVPVENKNCRQAMITLMNWARKCDPTRLVTYTSCRLTSDFLRRKSDISAVNFYFGWYYLAAQHLGPFLDMVYYATNPNVPVLLTEFGAGAKFGVRDPEEKYSEDNQAQVLVRQIQVLNSKPYIAGWFIWIYRDFRSGLRLNKFQQGFNRKGIVSELNEPKLVARIMPRIIRSTLTKIHHVPILAFFWGNLLKLIEFPVVKLLFQHEYSKERKLVENYYYTDPTERKLEMETV